MHFPKKPQIVALPNVVAAFELQPFGQFWRLREHRRVGMLFELGLETSQLALVFVVDARLDGTASKTLSAAPWTPGRAYRHSTRIFLVCLCSLGNITYVLVAGGGTRLLGD